MHRHKLLRRGRCRHTFIRARLICLRIPRSIIHGAGLLRLELHTRTNDRYTCIFDYTLPRESIEVDDPQSRKHWIRWLHFTLCTMEHSLLVREPSPVVLVPPLPPLIDLTLISGLHNGSAIELFGRESHKT
jgi:hypothetical protein